MHFARLCVQLACACTVSRALLGTQGQRRSEEHLQMGPVSA
jgi:hypothetical protein